MQTITVMKAIGQALSEELKRRSLSTSLASVSAHPYFSPLTRYSSVCERSNAYAYERPSGAMTA
jgi:hypothetical protein